MDNCVLCIYGPKYSGKSTLADMLIAEYGDSLELIETYTDRKERYVGEPGHNFVGKDKFDEFIETGEIAYHGKPLGENYRIGVSKESIDKAKKMGKVPIIATRVPKIIKGINEKYKGYNFIIKTTPLNFSYLIENAKSRDIEPSEEEIARLKEETATLEKLIEQLNGPVIEIEISRDFADYAEKIENQIRALISSSTDL